MMNMKAKHTFYSIGIIFFLGFLTNCRQPVIPTEEDLADYGWTLYEEKEYQEAREWFLDAVAKDSSFADGYHGIGWCFGNLRQADSAAAYFHISQVGKFYVKLDGVDKFGKMLPSGIYFVQLITDTGIVKNKKMMFLK